MIFLGVSRSEIMESNPKELWCYEDAFKIKRRYEDSMAHMQGFYNMKAFETVIGNAFGKKGRKPLEYLHEPLLAESIVEKTDDEKRQELLKQLVIQRKKDKFNFDLWKKSQNDVVS